MSMPPLSRVPLHAAGWVVAAVPCPSDAWCLVGQARAPDRTWQWAAAEPFFRPQQAASSSPSNALASEKERMKETVHQGEASWSSGGSSSSCTGNNEENAVRIVVAQEILFHNATTTAERNTDTGERSVDNDDDDRGVCKGGDDMRRSARALAVQCFGPLIEIHPCPLSNTDFEAASEVDSYVVTAPHTQAPLRGRVGVWRRGPVRLSVAVMLTSPNICSSSASSSTKGDVEGSAPSLPPSNFWQSLWHALLSDAMWPVTAAACPLLPWLSLSAPLTNAAVLVPLGSTAATVTQAQHDVNNTCSISAAMCPPVTAGGVVAVHAGPGRIIDLTSPLQFTGTATASIAAAATGKPLQVSVMVAAEDYHCGPLPHPRSSSLRLLSEERAALEALLEKAANAPAQHLFRERVRRAEVESVTTTADNTVATVGPVTTSVVVPPRLGIRCATRLTVSVRPSIDASGLEAAVVPALLPQHNAQQAAAGTSPVVLWVPQAGPMALQRLQHWADTAACSGNSSSSSCGHRGTITPVEAPPMGRATFVPWPLPTEATDGISVTDLVVLRPCAAATAATQPSVSNKSHSVFTVLLRGEVSTGTAGIDGDMMPAPAALHMTIERLADARSVAEWMAVLEATHAATHPYVRERSPATGHLWLSTAAAPDKKESNNTKRAKKKSTDGGEGANDDNSVANNMAGHHLYFLVRKSRDGVAGYLEVIACTTPAGPGPSSNTPQHTQHTYVHTAFLRYLHTLDRVQSHFLQEVRIQ